MARNIWDVQRDETCLQTGEAAIRKCATAPAQPMPNTQTEMAQRLLQHRREQDRKYYGTGTLTPGPQKK